MRLGPEEHSLSVTVFRLLVSAVSLVTAWECVSGGIPLPWVVYLSGAMLLPAISVGRAELAFIAYAAAAYGIPRYAEVYDVLVNVGVLNRLAFLALLGWAVHCWRTGCRPRLHWLEGIMLVFCGWLLASLLLNGAGDIITNANPRHGPDLYLQSFIMLWIFSQSRCHDSTLQVVAIALAGLICLRALVLGLNIHLSSDIGVMAAIILPLVLFGSREGSVPMRGLLAVLAILLVGIVMLTHNRNAGLALVAGLLSLLLPFRGRPFLGLLLLLSVGLLLYLLIPEDYLARFQAIWSSGATHDTATLDRNTVLQRLRLWTVGIEMAKDNPWFGVGPGHFGAMSGMYVRAGFDAGLATHNSFVSLAAEAGIPGLLLYIALFGGALLVLLRRFKDGRWTLWMRCSGYGVFGALLAALAAGLALSRQDLVLSYALVGWVIMLDRHGLLSACRSCSDP